MNDNQIRDLIVNYIQKHGYPPTIEEIGNMAGYASKNSTWNHVRRMFENGLLETDRQGSPRAIRVPGYKFVKET